MLIIPRSRDNVSYPETLPVEKMNREKFFQFATYRTTRDNRFKLFKNRAHLNVRANTFSLRVIDNWNNPADFVILPPLSTSSRVDSIDTGIKYHPRKFESTCYETELQQPDRDTVQINL